jgi:prepilin-type processing-associated H-X9-DG protein
MFRRPQFESLEKRVMFHGATLADLNPAVVETPDLLAGRTESVGNDETVTIAAHSIRVATGDVNGDGLDLVSTENGGIWRAAVAKILAEWPRADRVAHPTRSGIMGDFNDDGVVDGADYVTLKSHLAAQINQNIHVENDETPLVGLLLPYIEQDNVYKLASIADGTSNTVVFATMSAADSEDRLANKTEPGQGIIAILIGLATDPSDPSGNTASGANFVFADGSVRF